MKKFLAIILTTGMLFALAACGGGGSSQAGGGGTPSAGSTTEPAGSEEEIRVGVCGSMTGTMALNGSTAQRAIELAAAEVNEAGGIDGRMVRLITYDDQGDPAMSVKGITKFVESDNVHFVIACSTSTCAMAMQPILEEAGIPLLGLVTSMSVCDPDYQYTFRVDCNSDAFSKGMIDGALAMGAGKVGMLYASDDWGINTAEGLIQFAAEAGLEIVGSEQLLLSDNDFTSQITKLRQTGADAMFIVASQELIPVIAKQCKQLGFTGTLIATEGAAAKNVREVGAGDVEGMLFAGSYLIPDGLDDVENPAQVAYMEKHYEMFGDYPLAVGGYRGYDAIQTAFKAIRDTGSLEGSVLRDAIENTDYVGFAGPFDYKGRNGEGLGNASVFVIHDGINVSLERYLELTGG